MSGKIRMSVLATLFIALLVFAGCSAGNGQKAGNTNSNLSNGGFSVMRDDWIYFMNYADKSALYKIKADGTGEMKVSDEMAYSLNSYGDWIYYCNGSDNSKIYKMKPDGTEKSMVIDNIAQNVFVSEDWIYYINHNDGNSSEEYRKIFKVKTDGSGRQMVNGTDSLTFNLDGDWIYYVSNSDQKVYKLKTDGTGEVKVSDAAVSAIILLDGYIYYIDLTDGNNRIWRMKTDGTSAANLSDDKVTSFNVSGDWIYYGNTLTEAGLELKRMKLDGTQAEVINDDDPVVINTYGDLLLYLGFDFTNFSIKQTMVRADGSQRKDYEYKQEPQAQNVARYPMNEKVQAGPLTVIVTSAYSTNIMKNEEPGFEATVFDSVSDGAYLFVNIEIWNESNEDIDLYQRTGIIPEIDEMGLAIFWAPIAEVSRDIDITKHLQIGDYEEHMTIKAGADIRVQTYCEINEPSYPVYLGLFDGESMEPLAAIEVLPSAEHYVTSWRQSYDIMQKRFPESEITQLGGVGYKLEEDAEETIYYGFEVKDKGDAEVKQYLVKRDTGVIYIGAYDEKQPDYPAVPVKPLD